MYNTKKNTTVSKEISFSTSVSPNRIVAHLAPILAIDPFNFVLGKGVLCVILRVRLQRHPVVVAEISVVGASAFKHVTGVSADLIPAGWNASEAAL